MTWYSALCAINKKLTVQHLLYFIRLANFDQERISRTIYIILRLQVYVYPPYVVLISGLFLFDVIVFRETKLF